MKGGEKGEIKLKKREKEECNSKNTPGTLKKKEKRNE